MHKFVIFDTKTGRIIGHATGTRRAVEHDLTPGTAALQGEADPDHHRVEHGRIVPIGLAYHRRDMHSLATIEARSLRDRLLAQSDWSQLPDAPVDRAAWAAYRTALRDVTEQPGFPENIEWPEAPGGGKDSA